MKNDDLEKITNDLTQKPQSLLEKMNSLKDKIERFKEFKDTTILVDASGSMDSHVDENKRAFEVVNHVLESFQGCNLWEFNSRGHCIKVPRINYPTGGTAMDAAFDTMKSQNIKKFILITDGQPDNPDAALDSAKGLHIDIIYIGPPPAPPFLQKLARRTGGNFVDVELIKLGAQRGSKEIESKIRLMLNAKN